MEITTKYFPSVPKNFSIKRRIRFFVKDEVFGKVAGQKNLVRLYGWELFGIHYYSS